MLRAFSRLWAVAMVAALLVGCGDRGAERNDSTRTPSDTLPPAAFGERALRDSARVAGLLGAYQDALARGRIDDARALFFPESILVAREAGGIDVEGRSSELDSILLADRQTARPIRRIVLLRRSNRELLENTYRETWWARWVPEDTDSAVIGRRLHVLQQLGNDARWLGRMGASE